MPIGAQGLGGVVARVSEELAALDRELQEIAMLVGQATEETERHEGRRQKGEERLNALEKDSRADPGELAEARKQLTALTRRQMLFDAQREVLAGKQKTLARYQEGMGRVLADLAGLDPGQDLPAAAGAAPVARVDRPNTVPAMVLRAQEDLRRDIARQMHDGPAQSLANIALQSEIVERLVARGDQRATAELGALRRMVQSTLSATKEFIFDVRPMVLDDLGLVPTLRRTALDRGARAGLEVDFDSSGPDRRLGTDLESGLFRILDDLIAGYVQLRPERVTVRLDWSDRELSAMVRGHWQAAKPGSRQAQEHPRDLPPALAAMMEQKDTEERQALVDARSLPASRSAEIREHAGILGIGLTILDDGQATEIVAPLA
jgi:two-component system sensor histidine kinase DegS